MSRAPFTPAWSLTLWIDDQGRARGQQLRHHARPRFTCRAVEDDGDGPVLPMDVLPETRADVLTGVVWSGEDWTLCEFVWEDPPPADDGEYRALMRYAESALDLAMVATTPVEADHE